MHNDDEENNTLSFKGPKEKKKSPVKEQRQFTERIPIQLLVDYKAGGNYLFDFSHDLGEGGIFIQTESPKEQGDLVDLTFTLPDSKETISTRGKVIWVQNPVSGRSDLRAGMGVQFEAFSQEDRKALEAFVKRYSDKKTA